MEVLKDSKRLSANIIPDNSSAALAVSVDAIVAATDGVGKAAIAAAGASVDLCDTPADVPSALEGLTLAEVLLLLRLTL